MRVIRDTPADLPTPRGTLTDCEVVTIPDVAAYYGVPYTWLLKRIKAWQIPVLKPNAALNLLWRDDALRLREFNRKAS